MKRTMQEIGHLREIAERYAEYDACSSEAEECSYQIGKLEILQTREKIRELKDRIAESSGEQSRLETLKTREDAEGI